MTRSEFASKLLGLKSALIFCHVHSDGDTLSCAFALYYAYKKLGKNAEIVCDSEVNGQNLNWVPFLPKNLPTDEYDGCIAVDTPILEHLGKAGEFFKKQRRTFAIDHHITNSRYATFNYISDKPACSMVTYDVIKQMGVVIDKTIANCLLVGMLTDTNCFTIGGLDGEVFQTVSELIGFGADFSDTYDKLFRTEPKEKVLLIGKVFSNVKYFHGGKLAIITVSQETLRETSADESMTLGLVDYLTKIDGVDVGISILESRSKFYRISFRSRFTNVSEIASVFGGGGHIHASGAVLSGYHEDVIDKLVFTVGNYLL